MHTTPQTKSDRFWHPLTL